MITFKIRCVRESIMVYFDLLFAKSTNSWWDVIYTERRRNEPTCNCLVIMAVAITNMSNFLFLYVFFFSKRLWTGRNIDEYKRRRFSLCPSLGSQWGTKAQITRLRLLQHNSKLHTLFYKILQVDVCTVGTSASLCKYVTLDVGGDAISSTPLRCTYRSVLNINLCFWRSHHAVLFSR